jgi:2-oxoglutarate dehydrogenase E1 component
MAQITKTGMSELWENSAVYGESAAWLESMYETYLSDPDKLETRWRQYFDGLHSSAQF